MVDAASDEALLRRVASGDRAAMQALYARHNVRVYRFLVRLLGDVAMAEDLVSDVFLDVWQQAGRFEARSTVTTWLLSSARYKALSALRKRPELALDMEWAEAIEDDADTPEKAAEKTSESAALQRCLRKLSFEHREVIDLVYYHERSVAEASEILGIPESTVKTRMFYARKQLSELLKAAGIQREWSS